MNTLTSITVNDILKDPTLTAHKIDIQNLVVQEVIKNTKEKQQQILNLLDFNQQTWESFEKPMII